jgi:uncharacterized membrane protein YcgQ (UPF0703/DUF1980 family)
MASMLKSFKLFQTLTDRVIGKSSIAEKPQNQEAAIDIWQYAEPAGEEPDPLKRNLLQWRRLISSVRNPLETFPGQPVNVIGFVHRTPTDHAADQFTLASNAAQFETNTWLQVEGKFAAVAVGHKQVLMIEPDQIQPIPEPQKLYINGVF